MISGMRLAWNLMAWNLMAGVPDASAGTSGAGSATSAAGVLAGWTLVTAIVLGIVALILLLPATTGVRRLVGGLLGLVSLSLVLTGMMLPLAPFSVQWIFWGLATVTLIGAVAAVVTRKPVYTALWFAMSLLGTAGLLLFNGAEFLSISTVAVYAGAILVTFLFVLMFAQPEGHASYDRITWGWYAKATAAVMAGLLVAMLTLGLSAAGSTWVRRADSATEASRAGSGSLGQIWGRTVQQTPLEHRDRRRHFARGAGRGDCHHAADSGGGERTGKEGTTMSAVNETALLHNYLLIGGLLFAIGAVGFLVRRNLIVLFLCAEMMLQGITVSLVAWGRYYDDWGGQMLTLFMIAVAACEAALAMTLIVTVSRRSGQLDMVLWQDLREEGEPAYVDHEVPEERDEPPVWPALPRAGIEPEVNEQEQLYRGQV